MTMEAINLMNHTRKAKNATYAIRVTEDVYAELMRRQAERFRRDGKRPSLCFLVAEAVMAMKTK